MRFVNEWRVIENLQEREVLHPCIIYKYYVHVYVYNMRFMDEWRVIENLQKRKVLYPCIYMYGEEPRLRVA